MARAWREAEHVAAESLARSSQAREIGLEVRYALVEASMNSRAATLRPALVTASLRCGAWTLDRCLVYARQLPKVDDRARMLVVLTGHVPEAQRPAIVREVLALARSRGDDLRSWSQEVAACLAELGFVAEAIEIAGTGRYKRALLSVLPHLAGPRRAAIAAEVFEWALDRRREGSPLHTT